jgi:hypothetical protein
MFERTWEAAIALCRQGAVQGRAYSAAATQWTPPSESQAEPGPHFAVVDQQGQPVFVAPPQEEADAAALFVVARRFIEMEDAHERGATLSPYVAEPHRQAADSLREWGLLDDQGNLLKAALDSDPEPLLGYVVRVNNVYAYGVVKQSVLNAGTITPTGACESADEARRRASELLMLALVRGATVMGVNGVPAVIDLSAEPEEGAPT